MLEFLFCLKNLGAVRDIRYTSSGVIWTLETEIHSSHHHFHHSLPKPEDETNHILPSWYLFLLA